MASRRPRGAGEVKGALGAASAAAADAADCAAAATAGPCAVVRTPPMLVRAGQAHTHSLHGHDVEAPNAVRLDLQDPVRSPRGRRR
jgi:hypothetical protein